MFGSVYTGLSGLIAFSKGLDVISNNIANLNTPGYKGSDLLFRDLFYRYQQFGEDGELGLASKVGSGVNTKGTSVRFQQGDLQDTGSATDVAIDGNGLFILRSGIDTYYTRAGQFTFDNDGYLIARGSDARVAGIDTSGNLVDINISGLRTNPATPTSEVIFSNNLSSGAESHEISDIQIIDTLGGSHTFKMTFTKGSEATNRSWFIDVVDETNTEIATAQEIRFNGDGSPEEGYNSFTASYMPAGAGEVEISFQFGEPGSFSGATSFSGGSSANASNLSVESDNGILPGVLLSTSFDPDGTLKIKYTNDQESSSERLALAWFGDLQSLRQIGDGLFVAPASAESQVVAAQESIMGEIVSGKVEISNIDLTREFTDLIIMQRGFQASSQVLTVSNEMMQELMNNTGRNG